MGKIYTVDGHKIEFAQGSSTLNPWSSEYCNEINLPIICTSDITPYMMIDSEKIYHLRRHHKMYFDLIDCLESDVIVLTWKDIITDFADLFDDLVGNFSEMKENLERMKRNIEKLSGDKKN